MTFPVAKGDECLLVFAERSIDIWHKSGGVQNPGAKRFHSLSDATAFVGISSMVNKVPSYDPTNAQLKKDDGSVFITLKANGDLDAHAGGDINAHADGNINATCVNANVTATSAVTVIAPDIQLTGDVNITGKLDVSSITTLAGAVLASSTLAVTGALTQGGTDIGKNHTHSQDNDSGGNTEQDTGGVQ